jgi:[protein-PII] uridylyltransferase
MAEAYRGRLYELLATADLGVRSEELEVHFAGMPVRYWPRVDSTSLRWHLDIIHEFTDGLTRSDVLLAPPVLRWRHFSERGFSEVVVCAWDRLGLLAKIAGAFAAAGLNILRADIYTRADNVVLDVFQVCDENVRHVRDISRLKQMEQLLMMALMNPHGAGARALQTWMRYASEPTATDVANSATAPVVLLDNAQSEDYTVLEVQAPDRLGLLHDILEAISACNVDIAHAIVVTEDRAAADIFFLHETDGRKIHDAARLELIRTGVLAALN